MQPKDACATFLPDRRSPTRRTPTEKQIEHLKTLDDDALVMRAIEALHALNRRAKELRDRRNAYRRATFAKHLTDDMEAIYTLKDSFLEALVLSGRATVETFSVETTSTERECLACGRTWVGDSWCYGCSNDSGKSIAATRTWFVIDCGKGHRFHQPAVSVAVAAKAVGIAPHDPAQPQRPIPKIGMTIAAQMVCVEIATARLLAAVTLAEGDE